MLSEVFAALIGIPIRTAAIGADNIAALVCIPQLALLRGFIVIGAHMHSPFRYDLLLFFNIFATTSIVLSVAIHASV